MNNYAVKIKQFEGPLDLLIHLIEKDKINIYDIPIADITRQYISYLDTMKEYNLEIASGFIVMSATLLQIKSKMLLPKLPSETEEDPRENLINLILEYKKTKAEALLLKEKLNEDNSYFERQPQKNEFTDYKIKNEPLNKLINAFLNLIDLNEDIIIERADFNVKDKMENIISLLKSNVQGISLEETVLDLNNKNECITSFLAILELLKLNLIRVNQSEKFSNIYIFLRGQ